MPITLCVFKTHSTQFITPVLPGLRQLQQNRRKLIIQQHSAAKQSPTAHFFYFYRGFSLIELMMVLAIVVIMTQMAVPSLQQLYAKWQIQTAIRSLQHSFQRMKLQGLSRSQEVVLCGSNDGVSCSSNWQPGWMQFIDSNGNRQRDANETLLEYEQRFRNQPELQIFSPSQRYFRTWTSGALASQAGSIWFCSPARGAYRFLTQRLVVSRIGRTRIETTDENGAPLVCPTS